MQHDKTNRREFLDFSSGTIGGWMSHFINTVHFITGCETPLAATSFGGTYAPGAMGGITGAMGGLSALAVADININQLGVSDESSVNAGFGRGADCTVGCSPRGRC
jgi:hypothetical protein